MRVPSRSEGNRRPEPDRPGKCMCQPEISKKIVQGNVQGVTAVSGYSKDRQRQKEKQKEWRGVAVMQFPGTISLYVLN